MKAPLDGKHQAAARTAARDTCSHRSARTVVPPSRSTCPSSPAKPKRAIERKRSLRKHLLTHESKPEIDRDVDRRIGRIVVPVDVEIKRVIARNVNFRSDQAGMEIDRLVVAAVP